MHSRSRPGLPSPAALGAFLAGALLLTLYSRGGTAWLLGFVALLPWIWLLDRPRTWAGTLGLAMAMSMALALACLWWFGLAMGRFTGVGSEWGLVLLLLAAPLLQPQLLAWAMLRRIVRQRHGALLGALAGAAGWLGTEWALLKPLGDTLGHGLFPSALLRQAADLGGTAGLTLTLLAVNEALNAALARRRQGLRTWARPLLGAVVPPLLLAGYGWSVLNRSTDPQAPTLRMGLIQANITDLEARRSTQGSYAVVREVLDTHFAMTYDAVERQRADAVLWSETVYPTTFGQPKSEAGAGFDDEIRSIVNAAGVPFVFGTYDRDAAGEYNAAAVVEPGRGLVGFYRKTRLFPLTEFVPTWLEGPALRRALPWAGQWLPGTGARVLPLRLRDGRELPVQPLICRDSVDPSLSIAAARLGARALLTLSNDAWFSDNPQGAELHQAVAAFRSIETRLPQFRVTTNGYSAVIDPTGAVRAGALMNERTLVVGDLPVPVPPRTLVVAWGDWVGPTLGLLLLVALGAGPLWRRLAGHGHAEPPASGLKLPTTLVLLPPTVRWVAGALRGVARLSLLGLALAVLIDDALRAQTLTQLRLAVALVILPELAAWCLLAAYRSRVWIEAGALVCERNGRQLTLPLNEVSASAVWRLPLPNPGLTLRATNGATPICRLALRQPGALACAIAEAGGPAPEPQSAFARAREAVLPNRWQHPLFQFGLLPLLLALPAFYLHQNIAYGSGWGEWLTFGLQAYAVAFLVWWAAWSIGVLMAASVARVAVEISAWCGTRLRPDLAWPLRQALERLVLGLLYLVLPAWLVMRFTGVFQ